MRDVALLGIASLHCVSEFSVERNSFRSYGAAAVSGPERNEFRSTMCAALPKDERLIGGHVSDDVRFAADPADFDAVDPRLLSQAEVQPGPKVALIAAAAVDLGDLNEIAGHDSDAGAHAVAIALHAMTDGSAANGWPVAVSLRRIVGACVGDSGRRRRRRRRCPGRRRPAPRLLSTGASPSPHRSETSTNRPVAGVHAAGCSGPW